MVVVRVVLTSSKQWSFQAKSIREVMKELDRIRDKLYYLKSYSGASGVIVGINEVKKYFRYYQKKRGDPTGFLYEIRIEPRRIYLWLEGPIRETDMEAFLYAFSGDEIEVSYEPSRYHSAYKVKVW